MKATATSTGINVTTCAMRTPRRIIAAATNANISAPAIDAVVMAAVGGCNRNNKCGDNSTAASNAPQHAACNSTNAMGSRSFLASRYEITSSAPGGIDGRMYPGNLDCDSEKKTTGITNHSSRKSGNESPRCPATRDQRPATFFP